MQEEMDFPSVEQIQEWERQKKEEVETNKHRRFNTARAETVHWFSCLFCISILAITLPYAYVVWQNELIKELLKNFVFCIVAASFAICWAICWWGQLAPKLLAARKPRKSQILFDIGLSIPVAAIFANGVLTGASPMFTFALLTLFYGGRVALELGVAWIEYRTSPKYGRVSFFDYCNEVISEQEK